MKQGSKLFVHDDLLQRFHLGALAAMIVAVIAQNEGQPINQSLLAGYLNVTRVAINRNLSELEARGFISKHKDGPHCQYWLAGELTYLGTEACD